MAQILYGFKGFQHDSFDLEVNYDLRAGLRHVRGVRPNRAAKFNGDTILDPKNYVSIELPI